MEWYCVLQSTIRCIYHGASFIKIGLSGLPLSSFLSVPQYWCICCECDWLFQACNSALFVSSPIPVTKLSFFSGFLCQLLLLFPPSFDPLLFFLSSCKYNRVTQANNTHFLKPGNVAQYSECRTLNVTGWVSSSWNGSRAEEAGLTCWFPFSRQAWVQENTPQEALVKS